MLSPLSQVGGSNIYLDIILEMNPDLSVYESHEVTEQVEDMLKEKFGIFDIDIHVEPLEIEEDELRENIFNKLYRYEHYCIQGTDLDQYLNDNLIYIQANGQTLNKSDYLAQNPHNVNSPLLHFQMKVVSQKTMLVRYQKDHLVHSSLWRRHENWTLVFHQESHES